MEPLSTTREVMITGTTVITDVVGTSFTSPSLNRDVTQRIARNEYCKNQSAQCRRMRRNCVAVKSTPDVMFGGVGDRLAEHNN